MGSLVRTKGTKRLVAHFNEEFGTYIDFYRTQSFGGSPILPMFNPALAGYKGLRYLTLNLADPGDPIHSARADNLTLLPHLPAGAKQRHNNLERRWVWFLNTANVAKGSLSPANDKLIAGGIFKALGTKPGANYDYDSICFDAVEVNGPQTINVTDQFDGGVKYLLIVLMTPAMPTGSAANDPPLIDP
jgi:hypothetical protein